MKAMRYAASAVLVGAFLLSVCRPAAAAGPVDEEEVRTLQGAYGQASSMVTGRAEDERGQDVPVIQETKTMPAPAEAGKGGDKIAIPEGSKSFLPDYMTKAVPGSLWPLDSTVVRERAEALAKHFEEFYPEITYHVDWDDETVNAYAWRTLWGTRHVALKGGLLRHKALQIEGIALVLAHEIGHHYAGEPTYSGGLSCEGQADYWAAKDCMRIAYRESYLDMMNPAVEQIYTFFSKGVETEISPEEEMSRFEENKGCTHPPAACRRDTYLAAINGDPKPECAKFRGQASAPPRVAAAPDAPPSGG